MVCVGASPAVCVALVSMTVLALAAGVPLAQAGEPPTMAKLEAYSGFATRAFIGAEIDTKKSGSNTEYRLEYATNESGPWVVAREGTLSGKLEEEGENPGTKAGAELQHLKPETTYFARAIAEDASARWKEPPVLSRPLQSVHLKSANQR